MPLHDHRCTYCGKVEERFVALVDLDAVQWHSCGDVTAPMQRIFLRAPSGFVQRDICYDSPVDGRAVTSAQARRNDLARNGCVAYEPGMKQDAARDRVHQENRLEASLDRGVDEYFATAGSRKLEKLEQELRAGASVEVLRDSPATN